MKAPHVTRHHVVMALMALWALMFVHTVRAATLNEFMGDYDQNLLQWAAASCLLGGSIRTILSLESDKRAIRDIAATAAWDAVKSLVVGMFAFVCVQAVRSSGILVPNEIRFLAVMIAGWFRMAAFDWLMARGKSWLEARTAQIIANPLDKKKDAP